MSRGEEGTFIHALPLEIFSDQEKELNIRLEASRCLYNACLSEALRQARLIRESKAWQKAQNLPKHQKCAKERTQLFSEAKKAYNYSEYSLHNFVAQIRKSCWINEYVDSSVAQKIATRAYQSVDEYFRGKKGRPRFRGRNRFHSIYT